MENKNYLTLKWGANLNTVNKMEQTTYKPHSGNDFLADVSKRICPKAGQCANTPGGMICPKDVICPI